MKPRKITSSFSKREDATKAFQSPEQSLDLVAPLVHLPGVFPGARRVLSGGTTGSTPNFSAS